MTFFEGTVVMVHLVILVLVQDIIDIKIDDALRVTILQSNPFEIQ